MMRAILIAPILVTAAPDAASSQTRQFYGAGGNRIGSSTTDSQGTTTFYDASGKVTARASKSGDTTTIYDATGRVVGKATGGK
jgi:YD repeat-containing protein